MKTPRPKINLQQRLFSSRLVFIAGLFIVAGLGVTVAKEAYKSYRINKEIASIRDQIEVLEQQNQDFLHSLEYVRTDAFKEKEARQKLGLQKEGETAVAIPSPKPQVIDEQALEESLKKKEEVPSSNPRKWWNYFFVSRT